MYMYNIIFPLAFPVLKYNTTGVALQITQKIKDIYRHLV